MDATPPTPPRPGRWARLCRRLTGPDAALYRLADRWMGGESTWTGEPLAYAAADPDTPRDFLLADAGSTPDPAEAFTRLTWGGQLILVHRDPVALRAITNTFTAHDGFEVEAGPHRLRRGLPGLRLPLVGPGVHAVLLRKVALIQAGEDTDRFTFDVRLTRMPDLADGYVVVKRVPQYRRVVTRLQARFPEAGQGVLLQRAEKLVKRVFPVFLTREAAFLQLMSRDMPAEFRGRVPRALGLERAPDGTVKTLYMSWLRLGGEPMDHLDFAKQAAEMLSVLHDRVGIIHLDLRLDNMVISDGRVCFLDFGSAVRIGEKIDESPMLKSLFEEMMNTSQIQRTMGKMKDTGRLTSDVIVSAHGKIDKAVDMFYLSLQISRPTSNPDLLPFIRFDPDSEIARRIKLLVSSILRPTNPRRPHFISAKDVHAGLQKIERKVGAI